MCQITSIDRSFVTTNQPALPAVATGDTKADATSQLPPQSSPTNLRVLICSENVPPQVNGIARRIGMYADGLRNLGCDVGEHCSMYELSLRTSYQF